MIVWIGTTQEPTNRLRKMRKRLKNKRLYLVHIWRTQDFHASLAPMKETIRSQGVKFGEVSHHLKTNAHLIFGTGMSKKDTLSWAAKKHDEDPGNFLKNIGFKQE